MMDHITDLLPSQLQGSTYNAILVMMDHLTKYTVFIPMMKTDNMAMLAQQLHQFVFTYFCLPDTTFVSSMWGELLCLLWVWGSFSSAYHPQTDRQTKWMNQSLELFLHQYMAYDHSDWATLLPLAQLALND